MCKILFSMCEKVVYASLKYDTSLFLAFDIDYFTEVLDLNYLIENLKEDPKLKKFAKFNEALVGIIQDYSLVSFSKLHVEVNKI